MPGRIVVGIDGSQVPDAALRWAYEEARLHHATLDVVHAWTLPAIGVSQKCATHAICPVAIVRSAPSSTQLRV